MFVCLSCKVQSVYRRSEYVNGTVVKDKIRCAFKKENEALPPLMNQGVPDQLNRNRETEWVVLVRQVNGGHSCPANGASMHSQTVG